MRFQNILKIVHVNYTRYKNNILFLNNIKDYHINKDILDIIKIHCSEYRAVTIVIDVIFPIQVCYILFALLFL